MGDADDSNSVISGPYCVVYTKNRRIKYEHQESIFSQISLSAAAQGVNNLKRGGDVERGEVNQLKTGRQRLRWNLIFNLILFGLVPLPFWLPFCFDVSSEYPYWALLGVQGLFTLFWIVVGLLAIGTTSKLRSNRKTDFSEKIKNDKELSEIEHLAVISCYKEPVELISHTVQTLANQTMSKKITMVVSFEERTPDKIKKQGELCDRFAASFKEFLFTVHPFGQEGEIPGKCSNANCGIRTSLGHLQRRLGERFDPNKVLITTCDADSRFHPRYIEALTYQFLRQKAKDRNSSVFQVWPL